MRMVIAGLGVVLALSGCSGLHEAAQDGAREGAVEGALSVLGQAAVEEAAGVTLKGELDCAARPSEGGGHQVDCSGQTLDGKEASVKGSVTSVDAAKGVVRGDLRLTFDGKDLGRKECVGVC